MQIKSSPLMNYAISENVMMLMVSHWNLCGFLFDSICMYPSKDDSK